jgi:hypothetical protein
LVIHALFNDATDSSIFTALGDDMNDESGNNAEESQGGVLQKHETSIYLERPSKTMKKLQTIGARAKILIEYVQNMCHN